MVTAVFLLVVLAALGAFMVTISGFHHSASALDIQSTKAYQAARAGTEWGAYQSLRLNSCAATAPLAFPAGTALADFTVTVQCTRTTATELTTPVNVDRITAIACNQPGAGACPNPAPGANYVERSLTMTVGR